MILIVGLGNPGKNYAQNRHNTGFRLINYLAQKHSIQLKQNECNSIIGKGTISDKDIILAKPKTYVNNSGVAAKAFIKKYSLAPVDIIVAYDDLDLPLGRIRIRPGGSSGGHKGINSIIAEAESPDFARIKIGIGRPDEGQSQRATEEEIINYVLSDFTPEEEKIINKVIEKAAESVEVILAEGVIAAMNKHNKQRLEV